MQPDLDRLVALHGERYRLLISDALAFLARSEPTWNLLAPIDKDAYVADLIAHLAGRVPPAAAPALGATHEPPTGAPGG